MLLHEARKPIFGGTNQAPTRQGRRPFVLGSFNLPRPSYLSILDSVGDQWVHRSLSDCLGATAISLCSCPPSQRRPNAAHGHGITDTIAREWFDRYGVNVITTGNNAFDVKGIDAYFRQEPRLLRPANHPPDTAGNGWVKLHTPSGAEVLIINLMGRVHMPACDCPFRCVDGILQKERADLIIVDMHAEATSEAQAMGHHLDGRAAAVLGTHTHVPTLDAKVLPGGTAYVTDIGMTGPYEGVIGM